MVGETLLIIIKYIMMTIIIIIIKNLAQVAGLSIFTHPPS